MNKLLSSLAIVAFAMTSGAAFAGSHAGAPMDAKKKEEIDAINRRHSVEAMAREFQVSARTIENALSRHTWKHV